MGVVKQKLRFEDYKNCLENNERILRLQKWFRSEAHNVFTKNIKKTALKANNDKRLQTIDEIEPCLYGTDKE